MQSVDINSVDNKKGRQVPEFCFGGTILSWSNTVYENGRFVTLVCIPNKNIRVFIWLQ